MTTPDYPLRWTWSRHYITTYGTVGAPELMQVQVRPDEPHAPGCVMVVHLDSGGIQSWPADRLYKTRIEAERHLALHMLAGTA